MADIPAQLYTGSQIKPTITVTDGAGAITLTEGTDYTVAYGNNINKPTGTVTVKAATNGNYKFANVVKNFDITNGQLTVTILGDYDDTYNGSAVRDHDVLVKNTICTELCSSNYTVTYTYYICQDTPGDITTKTTAANSGAEGTGKAPVWAGDYVVEATVTADNYEIAKVRKAFSIAKKNAKVENIRQTSPETIYNTMYLFNIVLDGDKTPSEGTLKLVSGQTLEVGTKQYDWEFTPNDTRNYNAIRGSIRLTVDQDPGATTYTVRFNANGGTGTMADVTGVSSSYTLPANGFTAPAGKQFKGWATSANGAVITGTINVTADTTLYAIWEDATPAHTHHLTLVPANPATCTTDGHSAYYTCNGCDKWFEDAAGTSEITDHSSVNIGALDHNFTDAWSHDDRMHWHKCSRCDAKQGEANHDFGDDNICDICGYDKSVLHEHIYGSDWKSNDEQHWHECSCGDKADIAAHIESDYWVIDTPATATEWGLKHKECTACGYKMREEEIEPTGSGTITIIVPSTEEPTKPADQKNPSTGAAPGSIGYDTVIGLAAAGVLCFATMKLAKKDEE